MSDFLKPKGSYRNLISYQKTVCIYDLTYLFLQRYISTKDRTYDQMLQAARSGKQNIVEGRAAATTSKETEIRLYNVARASLQELLADYEDYLRTRQFMIWQPGHPRLEALRRTCYQSSDTQYYQVLAEKCNAEELGNMLITLIHQVDAMLGKLIEYAKVDFLREGGAREAISRARRNYRNSALNR